MIFEWNKVDFKEFQKTLNFLNCENFNTHFLNYLWSNFSEKIFRNMEKDNPVAIVFKGAILNRIGDKETGGMKDFDDGVVKIRYRIRNRYKGDGKIYDLFVTTKPDKTERFNSFFIRLTDFTNEKNCYDFVNFTPSVKDIVKE